MFGSDVEVGVPFMRRVPPVTNPSAKVSGLHQANLLETTQPPGERLRLRNQLFTGGLLRCQRETGTLGTKGTRPPYSPLSTRCIAADPGHGWSY